MESPLCAHIGALTQLSRSDLNPRVRHRALCLVVMLSCRTRTEAAQRLGTGTKQLRTWEDRYLAEGRDGLADRPRPGRTRLLDGDGVVFLQRMLTDLPTEHGYATATWTLTDLADVLGRHGWPVSLATVDRRLHELGYRYRRPRHDLQHRHPADAVATARQTLAMLQKKGVITPEEYASCISMSAICTPTPTWQRSGNAADHPDAFPPPESIAG